MILNILEFSFVKKFFFTFLIVEILVRLSIF